MHKKRCTDLRESEPEVETAADPVLLDIAVDLAALRERVLLDVAVDLPVLRERVFLDVAVDLAALRERVLLIATLTFPTSIHSFHHFHGEKSVTVTAYLSL